jgi:hypothetical protein
MPTATIIGSGPNGLSAAIVLAGVGVSTTICSGLDTLRVGREHALQWLAVPGPEEQEQLCADAEARRSVAQLAPSLDRCFLPDSLAKLIVRDARGDRSCASHIR